MIVILDPALFWTPTSAGALPDAELDELEWCLDDAVRVCSETGGRIPNEPGYWVKLQKEMVGPLVARSTGRPRLRQATMALQRLAGPLPSGRSPGPGRTRMWCVRAMFSWAGLPPGWLDVMQKLLVRCALLDEPCLLVARLLDGRNTKLHCVGRCDLREKLCWRLYVHTSGAPPRSIPCVTQPRNLKVPWTARFDHRLPATQDGARYPFCPPDRWWLRAVQAHDTAKSKPAWLDRRGNAWIRPATGGGHHWDVFIAEATVHERIGLNQINVVEWGTPEPGKLAGHLHHVPTSKQGRLKSDTGWTCD